jgi:F1F0 ATPase subunit 2
MTTSDYLALGLIGLIGMLLGAFFFGGLHWTIRKGLTVRLPALWFLGSLILRMGITLVTFYLVSRGSWQRLLACVCGFAIGRILIGRFVHMASKHQPHCASEV